MEGAAICCAQRGDLIWSFDLLLLLWSCDVVRLRHDADDARAAAVRRAPRSNAQRNTPFAMASPGVPPMRRLSYFELEACEQAGEESNPSSPSVPAVRLAPQHTMEELIALEDAYGAHNYHPLDVWCGSCLFQERGRRRSRHSRHRARSDADFHRSVESAEGAWVTAIDGKRYLDCLAAYSGARKSVPCSVQLSLNSPLDSCQPGALPSENTCSVHSPAQ